MKIRILLVDDHTLVRNSLQRLMSRMVDVEVVAEAGDGLEAIELARQHRPDVVLMDVTMPRLNGIDATRRICDEHPQIKVLGLSAHLEHGLIAEMLRAGALGYILKESTLDEFAEAIREVAAGRRFLGRQVTDVVLEDYLDQLSSRSTEDDPKLTSREREVLQMLAEGRPNREVAAELHISVKTVETHRSNILKKLGFKSAADLARYAIRAGLTPLR